MHTQRALMEKRIDRTLTERIRRAETTPVIPLNIAAWQIPATAQTPGPPPPVSFATARSQNYSPLPVDSTWGPAWTTTWLHVYADIPAEMREDHLEIVIDLGWFDHSPGFQCEGLVYDNAGIVVKAINPKNQWLGVPPGAARVEFFIEAAANPLLLEVPPFQETPLGDPTTCGPEPLFRLARAEVVKVHTQVRELIADLTALYGLCRTLPDDSPRTWELLTAMTASLDNLSLSDIPGSAQAARDRLQAVLAQPADAAAHHLTAVAHAHIDSAWLWPVRETRRKVVRTLANVLRLLDDGFDFTFALPAAQHLAWLQQDAPEVFARVKAWVEKGRIVPVGGMWVEPDAVLPGSESITRQIVHGTRFFATELGVRTREFWLPDSFGYSGALPQLARLGGAHYFLTQKISWNQINKFPHHSFWWEGIDGSRIFTHFPSADTYGSDLSAAQLAHAERNFADKGATNRSLIPFGYGDGGGGPMREMLWQGQRCANLAGSPRVHFGTPAEFFADAVADHPQAETWVGELYLELHRGTLTTQANTKAGNRRCEALLRAAEAWCATAAARGLLDYPAAELTDCWQAVLLGQFHDILPGSSISWVHDEIEQTHREVAARLRDLIAAAMRALVGDQGGEAQSFNVTSFPLAGVAPFSAAPALAVSAAEIVPQADGYTLQNEAVSLHVTAAGYVTSFTDRATGWQAIPAGVAAGELHLHDDFPNTWDAWDIEAHDLRRFTVLPPQGVEQVTAPDRAGVRVSYATAVSTFTVTYWLASTGPLTVEIEADWHEREKLLKFAWPLNVHTTTAKFETHYGHLTRPIHTNTSWDAARFEVSAHRWVLVDDGVVGMAIANDATHGYELVRRPLKTGATYVELRPSLLRSPVFPDPAADVGHHTFRFTFTPTADVLTAVAAAQQLALPPLRAVGQPVPPLVEVSGTGLVVEALKLADDGSGDVIVRLYEARGTYATGQLRTSFPLAEAIETDLLEETLGQGATSHLTPTAITAVTDGVALALRPFQVVTLRLKKDE